MIVWIPVGKTNRTTDKIKPQEMAWKWNQCAHRRETHFLKLCNLFFLEQIYLRHKPLPCVMEVRQEGSRDNKNLPLILTPTFLKLPSSEGIFGWIGKHVCFLFYLLLLPYWEQGCQVFSWQWPKKSQRCYAVFSGCWLSSPLGSTQEPQSFLHPRWYASSGWPLTIA